MRIAHTETFWARIHISGPIDEGKRICRRYCLDVGLCVTITPTTYIYTGGEEAGYIVELINYPRFPSDESKVENQAKALAYLLRDGTSQQSVLVMTPKETTWYTIRPGN